MDDDEMAMDDDEMAMDDDETIDMTDASDDEVLRVFKAMGDEDGIIVKKDGENIHLKDGEDEYMIHLGESDLEDFDIDSEDYFEMDFKDEVEETIYEIEMGEQEEEGEEGVPQGVPLEKMMMDEDELYGDAEVDFEGNRYGMDEEDSDMVFEIEMDGEEDEMFGGNKHDFHRRHGHKMGDVGGGKYGKGGHYKDYEMEEGMDYEEEDKFESVMEAVKKSLKKSVKPKGVGIGSGPKFSYDKKPNMGGGFNTKKKEAFGKGTKAMGTGKAKFEYKEGENMEKGSMKKVETKEAVRTNSYTRANKVGNRKGSNQNVNRQEIRQRPNTRVNESRNNQEVQLLREKNEEYRKALDVFRTKLNEVAVFNSNLAYATRLFTEHSTTKQEKINILRRFDNVESLKESKNLYRSIKNELSTGSSSSEQKINESIERTVNRSVETGSSVNLIESKTYENPQFLRMKDLMGKIK